jgi:DNA polymerase III delta prime subunit
VNLDNLYSVTGIPSPSTIQEIIKEIFNSTPKNSFEKINTYKTNFGVSLGDIIKGVMDEIKPLINDKLRKIEVFKLIGDLNNLIENGGNERIALSNFIIFIKTLFVDGCFN